MRELMILFTETQRFHSKQVIYFAVGSSLCKTFSRFPSLSLSSPKYLPTMCAISFHFPFIIVTSQKVLDLSSHVTKIHFGHPLKSSTRVLHLNDPTKPLHLSHPQAVLMDCN